MDVTAEDRLRGCAESALQAPRAVPPSGVAVVRCESTSASSCIGGALSAQCGFFFVRRDMKSSLKPGMAGDGDSGGQARPWGSTALVSTRMALQPPLLHASQSPKLRALRHPSGLLLLMLACSLVGDILLGLKLRDGGLLLLTGLPLSMTMRLAPSAQASRGSLPSAPRLCHSHSAWEGRCPSDSPRGWRQVGWRQGETERGR
mmetsp:Transcript_62282/g.137013  ORF Transcript_62282/g.137013 Transcript_62282/m.137013 type:complete len:203 (+) Transcript_62282:278-886(+)